MLNERLLSAHKPSSERERRSSSRLFHDLIVRGSASERWLLRGLLAVTSVSLLATSPPPQYSFSFERAVPAPSFKLTAAERARAFRITVRATGLGPNGRETTTSATINASGDFVQESETGGFVRVQLRGDGRGPGSGGSSRAGAGSGAELDALTQFALSDELVFTGNCADPSQGDCQATAIVEFGRRDSASKGDISVNWSVRLQSRVSKGDDGPDEGPLDPPWEVTVSEL